MKYLYTCVSSELVDHLSDSTVCRHTQRKGDHRVLEHVQGWGWSLAQRWRTKHKVARPGRVFFSSTSSAVTAIASGFDPESFAKIYLTTFITMNEREQSSQTFTDSNTDWAMSFCRRCMHSSHHAWSVLRSRAPADEWCRQCARECRRGRLWVWQRACSAQNGAAREPAAGRSVLPSNASRHFGLFWLVICFSMTKR